MSEEREPGGRPSRPALRAAKRFVLGGGDEPAARDDRFALALAALGLLAYAVTRFLRLDEFPIYFVGDEAIKGVLASELLANRFRDGEGRLFPFFFDVFGSQNPLVSVYLHALALKLFGQSIAVVRGVSAFLSLTGAAAVCLTLRDVFRARLWWVAAPLLAAMPCWFLHSRTGFETAATVSLFSWFLYFYLRYRMDRPWFLIPALVFAGFTFYTYGNGQIVVGVTGLLLGVSDLRHHLRSWKVAIAGVLVVAAFAVPTIRFRKQHPEEVKQHLRMLDSYLFKDTPAAVKLKEFGKRYAYGLGPTYWFLPNSSDQERHRLAGYPHIPIWMLPFFAGGLIACLVRPRSPAHRAVLVALLASPVGGAITEINITRVLTYVVPAALLTSLGIEGLAARVRSAFASRWSLAVDRAAAAALLAVLVVPPMRMLGDALRNGPTWSQDYTLYGQQWGAKQVFGTVSEIIRAQPLTTVHIDSTWANGADKFVQFFLPRTDRVTVRDVFDFMERKQWLADTMLFVMSPYEVGKVKESGLFEEPRVELTIPYPDGRVGFTFARLRYVADIDAIFAERLAEKRKPVTEEYALGGVPLTVEHSKFDMGTVKELFDGDTYTLVRGLEANPLAVDVRFPKPRRLSNVVVTLGHLDMLQLSVKAYGDGDAELAKGEKTLLGEPGDPRVEVALPGAPLLVRRVRVEVTQLQPPPDVHIHVREIEFR